MIPSLTSQQYSLDHHNHDTPYPLETLFLQLWEFLSLEFFHNYNSISCDSFSFGDICVSRLTKTGGSQD